ncbi:MAG TPA: ParB N-terminal domain-containing protein [bacterium]|nr:ParB N-terminal domain-containing protein [bacterium]
MYQDIEIDRLLPHPENSNRMDPKLMKKLEENIRKSGNYETITVRPHPQFEGDYQILNGHHRVEILKRIGFDRAKCDVWDINDAEARLLIATLNRLEGQDVPELRHNLIQNLLRDFDIPSLESLIPESAKQIEDMIELSKEEFKDIEQQIKEMSSHFEFNLPDLRMLEFVMNSEQYKTVVEALEIMKTREQLADENEALYELAKRYTEQTCALSSSASSTDHSTTNSSLISPNLEAN